jgi:hypothetical protein
MSTATAPQYGAPGTTSYPVWLDCSEKLRREYLGGVIDARTYAREIAHIAHSAPDDVPIRR